jgi:hypothetical protein
MGKIDWRKDGVWGHGRGLASARDPHPQIKRHRSVAGSLSLSAEMETSLRGRIS